MPTLRSRRATVQLSVADLQKVTTGNPLNKQCPESTSDIMKTEQEFVNAGTDRTLAEEPFLGEDGYRLQYLGSNKDFPFLMVRAGKEFFNSNALIKRTGQPAVPDWIQKSDKSSRYDSYIDEGEKREWLFLEKIEHMVQLWDLTNHQNSHVPEFLDTPPHPLNTLSA